MRFLLTFTKEIECSVEAESEEKLREAAEQLDDYDLRDWYSDGWRVSIINVSKWPRWSHDNSPKKPPDCGLVNGEILAWEDYEKAMKEKENEKQS